MSYKPIIINAGQFQQLPSGQALNVGGWTLPTAGGTVDYVLMADGSGNATWAQVDHGNTTGRDDDDHTIYSLVDGTRAFSGVVGGVTPTDHPHLATKEYIDSAIQVIQPLFLLDAAHASIASTKNTQVFDSGLAQADVTTASVVDDQVLQAWADATAESIARDIPTGVFALHIHAAKTSGQENLQLYFKIFEVDSGFSETLIMTSETSDEITSEEHIALHSVLGAPYAISVGSWILIRVYATVTGSGNAPTAVLYYQGATSARFDLPTLSVTIDHGHLLGLTDDDHGGYHTDARADTWLAAGHETTYAHANYDTAYGWGDHASGGYLKANGSVPLTANWAAGAFNITGTGTVVGSNIPAPTGNNQVLISTAADVASWITAGNNQYLASNSSGNVRWENKTGDASLWIATTGNDSTGDGTEGDPYATIGKCITEFQAMSFDPGDTATINFEDGEYTGLSTITLPRMVPMLKLAGRAAYSFTMSDTVSQANVAGNVYDLRITLDTTTNISAGNFVVIPRCASLPELNGCWEVQTVHDSTDITIRVTWAREAPHIGAYAATVAVPRAHFNRTGGTFLAVYTHLTLNGLIFEGTAGRGILLFAGTTLEIRSYVGFSGWDYGLYIVTAAVDIRYCAISNCTNGMYLVNTSSAVVQWIAISGCSKGYNIDRLSHLYIGDESYAASCYWGVVVAFGSSAKIFYTVFINNTAQGVEASFGAIIRIAACTFTDNASDYSPALDTQGNDNSWITT